MDDDIAYYEQLQAEQEEYEVWVSDRLWPEREILTKILLFLHSRSVTAQI